MGDTDSLEKNRVRDVMDADSSGQHSGIIMHTRYDHNRPTFQTLPSWATETTDYNIIHSETIHQLPVIEVDHQDNPCGHCQPQRRRKHCPQLFHISCPRRVSAPIDPEKSL